MIYLSQLNEGLLLLTSQLFLGRVISIQTHFLMLNVLVETKSLTYLKILRDASLNSKDRDVKGSWRHERRRGEACLKMGWQQYAM